MRLILAAIMITGASVLPATILHHELAPQQGALPATGAVTWWAGARGRSEQGDQRFRLDQAAGEHAPADRPAAATAGAAQPAAAAPAATDRRVSATGQPSSAPEMGAMIGRLTGLPVRVATELYLESGRRRVPLPLVLGVIDQESAFTPDLVYRNRNGTHDTGLMQLNSGTYPWLAQQVGIAEPDPRDPIQNLRMGIWYLAHLRDACSDDWHCALSRYNGDSANVYAPLVLSLRSEYQERLRQAVATSLSYSVPGTAPGVLPVAGS